MSINPIFIRLSKCNLKQIKKYVNFSSSSNVKPISMAYNLYSTTDKESGAPPLLIMHGLFGSKQNWRGVSRGLLQKLVPNRKIIALDARNHGESPHTREHSYEHLSEDIAFFLKEHNIAKCCVMGHSMGGRAIMHFILKYPNLADRAIVVDISPINMPRDFNRMDSIFSAMRSIHVPDGTQLAQARKLVEKQLKKAAGDQGTIDFLMLNLKKTENGFQWTLNLKALHDNFKNFAYFSEELINEKIYNGPTLFIGGSHSNFIDPFKFDVIKDLFPSAELDYIDSGHNIHLDNPDELSKPNDWPAIQKIFPNSKIVWSDCGHLIHFEKPAEFQNFVADFINQ